MWDKFLERRASKRVRAQAKADLLKAPLTQSADSHVA
jgi:hypothetical protein